MRQSGGRAFISILGWCGFAACGDGQAPSAYRGEPLMSLNGTVTASESALTRELVPALVVSDVGDLATSSDYTLHFLMGDVEGAFPNSFTLRLYDPPPPETLSVFIDGEPAFARGSIVAVSPEHPAWLKTTSHEEAIPGGSAERIEMCSETECISSTYLDCPSGEQDPNWAWPCGTKLPDHLHWDTYGYAKKHEVAYFGGDVSAESVLAHLFNHGEAFAAGYHVLELNNELLEQDLPCYERVNERARGEWVKIKPDGLFGDTAVRVDTPEENHQYNQIYTRLIVEEGCVSPVRLIDDPESRVQLEFVDQLTASAFGF